MIEFIKDNKIFLEKSALFFKDINFKKRLWEYINKEHLVILSWLKSKIQIKIVSDLIKTSNYKNNYLYINKALDYKNVINNISDLFSLYDIYIKDNNRPSIIIFENMWKIDWFKDFLNHIYKLNIKIIVIWNDIEIWSKPEIKVNWISIKQLESNNMYDYTITNLLKYGSNEDILLLKEDFLKERFLELNKDNIIYDLIKSFSIKNINLYNYTITYLSIYNWFISLRELHKEINQSIKLALLSSMEYVDYSIKSCIIEKMSNYDIKESRILIQKAKYFFTDLWFRNSLNNYKTDNYILKENLVYNELRKNWYNVKWWLFWVFEFNFISEKDNHIFHILLNKDNTKIWIKKEIRKMQKVYQYNSTNILKNVILIENLNNIWFKKTKFEDVELVDFEEFIKKSL